VEAAFQPRSRQQRKDANRGWKAAPTTKTKHRFLKLTPMRLRGSDNHFVAYLRDTTLAGLGISLPLKVVVKLSALFLPVSRPACVIHKTPCLVFVGFQLLIECVVKSNSDVVKNNNQITI
jgi:hypothetical protein